VNEAIFRRLFRDLPGLKWIGLLPWSLAPDPVGSEVTACETSASSRQFIMPRLRFGSVLTILRAPMANRAIWSMRKRHEWLSSPLKKKRVKRATRVRCGLQDAIDRRASGEKTE
jgi:hypothetical protein